MDFCDMAECARYADQPKLPSAPEMFHFSDSVPSDPVEREQWRLLRWEFRMYARRISARRVPNGEPKEKAA